MLKSLKKRFVSAFLAVVMAFSALPLSTLAVDSQTDSNNPYSGLELYVDNFSYDPSSDNSGSSIVRKDDSGNYYFDISINMRGSNPGFDGGSIELYYDPSLKLDTEYLNAEGVNELPFAVSGITASPAPALDEETGMTKYTLLIDALIMAGRNNYTGNDIFANLRFRFDGNVIQSGKKYDIKLKNTALGLYPKENSTNGGQPTIADFDDQEGGLQVAGELVTDPPRIVFGDDESGTINLKQDDFSEDNYFTAGISKYYKAEFPVRIENNVGLSYLKLEFNSSNSGINFCPDNTVKEKYKEFIKSSIEANGLMVLGTVNVTEKSISVTISYDSNDFYKGKELFDFPLIIDCGLVGGNSEPNISSFKMSASVKTAILFNNMDPAIEDSIAVVYTPSEKVVTGTDITTTTSTSETTSEVKTTTTLIESTKATTTTSKTIESTNVTTIMPKTTESSKATTTRRTTKSTTTTSIITTTTKSQTTVSFSDENSVKLLVPEDGFYTNESPFVIPVQVNCKTPMESVEIKLSFKFAGLLGNLNSIGVRAENLGNDRSSAIISNIDQSIEIKLENVKSSGTVYNILLCTKKVPDAIREMTKKYTKSSIYCSYDMTDEEGNVISVSNDRYKLIVNPAVVATTTTTTSTTTTTTTTSTTTTTTTATKTTESQPVSTTANINTTSQNTNAPASTAPITTTVTTTTEYAYSFVIHDPVGENQTNILRAQRVDATGDEMKAGVSVKIDFDNFVDYVNSIGFGINYDGRLEFDGYESDKEITVTYNEIKDDDGVTKYGRIAVAASSSKEKGIFSNEIKDSKNDGTFITIKFKIKDSYAPKSDEYYAILIDDNPYTYENNGKMITINPVFSVNKSGGGMRDINKCVEDGYIHCISKSSSSDDDNKNTDTDYSKGDKEGGIQSGDAKNIAEDSGNKTVSVNNNDYKIGDLKKENLLLGDANLNGTVDAKDATVILVAYANHIARNDSYMNALKYNCDTNFDRVYDAKDATNILVYYAYRIAGFIDDGTNINSVGHWEKGMENFMWDKFGLQDANLWPLKG